jgi:hypothetical protein
MSRVLRPALWRQVARHVRALVALRASSCKAVAGPQHPSFQPEHARVPQPPCGEWTDYLIKETGNRVRIAHKEEKESKFARLKYRVIKTEADGTALIEADLLTGRPHQIRAQFASSGFPLWGDQRYNPAAVPGQWLALWSIRIELEHPTRKEPMIFEYPPEAREGTVWTQFPSLASDNKSVTASQFF